MGLAGGLNLYAYAEGDPLSYIDPLGLCAEGSYGPTAYLSAASPRAFEPTAFLTDGSAAARYLQHANNFVSPPHMWGTPTADMVQDITYTTAAGEIAGGVIASGIGRAINAARGGNSAAASKTTSGRVFWSGGTTAREGAEAFARQTGGQTLEMTKTGRFLDAITTEKTYPYLKPAWNKASQNFARGAEGAVDVFHSSQGVRLESVWKTVEYPELLNGGNTINFHVTP